MALDVESLVAGATALGTALGGGLAGFKLIMRYVGNGKTNCKPKNAAPVPITLPCAHHSGLEAKIDALKERLVNIEAAIGRIFERLNRGTP